MPDDTLVVYSDYVCPFCYLGKDSLERYLAEAEDPPSVEWRAFDLRRHKRGPDGEIDHSVDDGKNESYFEQAKRNVERLADEYGVEMTWDVDRDVDSWNAHKLTVYAEREHDDDTVEALRDGIFEALWRDGRRIGDRGVLVDVGTAAGLDEAEVLEALDDDALDEAVEERFRDSHREGVTGVPTFSYGSLRVPGAVPPDDIASIVENG